MTSLGDRCYPMTSRKIAVRRIGAPGFKLALGAALKAVAVLTALVFCAPVLRGQTKPVRGHAPKTASPPAAKAQGGARAVLLIEGAPAGARVYVDNKLMGKTNSNGELRLRSLSPGVHRVRLTHRKLEDYEEILHLSSGRTTSIDTKLVAASYPAGGVEQRQPPIRCLPPQVPRLLQARESFTSRSCMTMAQL